MKKRMLSLLLAALLLLSLCACGGPDYSNVKAALQTEQWYFNNTETAILNRVSFTEEGALLEQVSFNDNGRHEEGSRELTYTIDESNVNLMDGEEIVLAIPYTMTENQLTLADGYLTLAQIDEGLQGYWMNRSYNSFFGRTCGLEEYIYFDHGKVSSEKAAESGYDNTEGYFYYGPYEGSYQVGFGQFETDMMHGAEWGFSILDGEVIVLHFARGFEHVDITGFPGEDGYNFD